MNLIIDFGNTRIKCFIFDDADDIVWTDSFLQQEISGSEKLNIPEGFSINKAVYVASGQAYPNLIQSLSLQNILVTEFGTHWNLPFSNLYKTPETLGADRLAAVCGAWFLNAGKPSLTISLGTCVTWDLLTERGYEGGGISPGIQMRLRSLHDFTNKLPFVQEKEAPNQPGKTTIDSILHGTLWAMQLELAAVINDYQKRYKDLTIYITGGDMDFLEGSLKNGIFARPNILAVGLNFMLKHYAF
jgi:type III pantothenate kinase